MYSPKLWCVLLIVFCIAPGPLTLAQSTKPAGDSAAKKAAGDDVKELRREVEELRAQVQRLLQASGQKEPAVSTSAPQAPPAATRADVDDLQKEVSALQKKASDPPPATAGWNGEHFFLRSSDGQFTLMPVGYVDGQYNVYGNTYGTPPDSFQITRAR